MKIIFKDYHFISGAEFKGKEMTIDAEGDLPCQVQERMVKFATAFGYKLTIQNVLPQKD